MSEDHYTEDILAYLVTRMSDAEVKLTGMAVEHQPRSDERKRLEGKANGVHLAQGYVLEALAKERAR